MTTYVLIVLSVAFAGLALIGWNEAFKRQQHNYKLQADLGVALAEVTRVEGHKELVRGYLDEAKEDLRDANHRIATMKKDGFDAGVPEPEVEDDPRLPAEMEGFLSQIHEPVASRLREDAIEAMRAGREPSDILSRYKKGRPLWAS